MSKRKKKRTGQKGANRTAAGATSAGLSAIQKIQGQAAAAAAEEQQQEDKSKNNNNDNTPRLQTELSSQTAKDKQQQEQ
jgi:hypothetical protein